MKRYVALVVRGRVGWTVLFPDFPGAEESGASLHAVLWKAHRLIADRAMIFTSLGVDMPAPMHASEIVSSPGYANSIPFIIAVPRPRGAEGGNVFRFG
jgi:hypothetical protein